MVNILPAFGNWNQMLTSFEPGAKYRKQLSDFIDEVTDQDTKIQPVEEKSKKIDITSRKSAGNISNHWKLQKIGCKISARNNGFLEFVPSIESLSSCTV